MIACNHFVGNLVSGRCERADVDCGRRNGTGRVTIRGRSLAHGTRFAAPLVQDDIVDVARTQPTGSYGAGPSQLLLGCAS